MQINELLHNQPNIMQWSSVEYVSILKLNLMENP